MSQKAPLQRRAAAGNKAANTGARSAAPVNFNPTAESPFQEGTIQEAMTLAQAQVSHDWTDEQRSGLNLGDQIGPDINRRVPQERQAELNEITRQMLVEADKRTHPRQAGVITYNEISQMLHTISGMDIPTVEKVVMWNYIGINARHYTISNTGVRDELIDEWAPGATHKHIVLPFTDDYHGEMGGAEGDPNVNFADVDPPHWIDLDDAEQRAWWESVPSMDSMSEGPGRLSTAYATVLWREDRHNIGGLRGFFGAHRADALASFATIENIRSFRWGGFAGFANSFEQRILD